MRNNHVPTRSCVGCRARRPKNELIRLAKVDGVLGIDSTGRAEGRGAYLCGEASCLETAVKKRAIQRTLRAAVTEAEITRLREEFENIHREEVF